MTWVSCGDDDSYVQIDRLGRQHHISVESGVRRRGLASAPGLCPKIGSQPHRSRAQGEIVGLNSELIEIDKSLVATQADKFAAHLVVRDFRDDDSPTGRDQI